MNDDRAILRELAKQYAEVCALPVQDARRDLWRKHNSLEDTRPPIYIRAFAWREMPHSKCLCEDPLLREHENFLRYQLFWSSLGDDAVFEPWITVRAVTKCEGWGVSIEKHVSDDARGSYKIDYPIKVPADIAKLRAPWHEINEEETARRIEQLTDVLGDILTVDVDRFPVRSMGTHDISWELGVLRGIENFMLDMLDRPEWLHELAQFLGDGLGNLYDQAEATGDWGLGPHRYSNQAMAYSQELRDPAPNVRDVPRSQLWCFMAAQEFTGVSPAMHEEFLLRYQEPIMSKFGLSAYGCCEDLTNKIDMLRQIPNLRRIAVTPFADAARCAEQIGRDYVVSYRPSPTDMVGYGLDAERVRGILRRDLEACKGCCVDITLKDVETVESDPDRVRNWVAMTRGVIDDTLG